MPKITEFLFGGSCLNIRKIRNSDPQGLFFQIPSRYGYVVLTAVGSLAMVSWKAYQVEKARKEYKVHYPIQYSKYSGECTPNNHQFNCIQRSRSRCKTAYRNTLEQLPIFITLLAFGGLEMPVFSSIGGAIWIAGRVQFAKGYYTGEPRKRMRGAFGYVGLVMVLGSTLKFAIHLWLGQ